MSKRPLILALALGAACAPACGGSDPETNPLGSGGNAASSTSTFGIELPPPRLIATVGVTIKEIALYQAVKRPLMADGAAATSDTPIVAGRDALLRVFVDVDMSHDLVGRLYFDGVLAPIEVKQTIAMSSVDARLDSTIDFDIPGALLTPTTKYRVEVGEIEATPSTALAAPSYPATGSEPIPGEKIGALKIVLAPISYKGNVAKLTDKQIQDYTDGFRTMYPAPTVELTVRAKPIVWNNTVDANGNGWGDLLDHVATVRQMDKAANDVYYFAPFAPTANIGQFCGTGCVAGLGLLGDANDSFSRAAIGLAYGDPDSIITAIHEIGHNLGREHAPCDVDLSDTDPQFPHKGGLDGVWGYSFITAKLFPPTVADLMGYCTPVWVSDYTFKGLFDRMKLVSAAQRVIVPEALRNRMYDRALVNSDGSLRWLSSMRLELPPATEVEKSIVVEFDSGTETTKASFYRFDHLAGGIVMWPATERTTRAVRIDVAPGKTVRLAR